MGNETESGTQSWAAKAIAMGKDLVSLLRDAALFLLAVLLIAFPQQFNAILVDAGFEEGSLVGFKWKSKLVESNQALSEAQATIAELQGKNDELVRALAEANTTLQDPKQMAVSSRLEEENRKLREATQRVQTIVSDSIAANTPYIEKALSAADRQAAGARGKSDLGVGLQTLGVPDAERVALNDSLRAEGYGLDPVTWSYAAGERPAWFATRSTVFYYAASAQAAAQELARFMKLRTGQDFVVQRGAGLGVDPARRDLTLYVHYIKP